MSGKVTRENKIIKTTFEIPDKSNFVENLHLPTPVAYNLASKLSIIAVFPKKKAASPRRKILTTIKNFVLQFLFGAPPFYIQILKRCSVIITKCDTSRASSEKNFG